MGIQKPSIPKGTRDFSPDIMIRRNMIFDTIRSVFQKFGFLPIETPSMENLSVLTGKYGDEGDQLIFKILNSGNYMDGIDEKELKENPKKHTSKIAEKALRYDLTVPFARYVTMNRNEITFPFKRFQIQPVWRADRPQKGRYREFYQCDADVVGTNSLICEAEIIIMVKEVLGNLGLKDFTIKINNRKVLTGLAEVIGMKGCEVDLCVAIDKLDKIGKDGVIAELKTKMFTESAIEKLLPLFNINGNSFAKLGELESFLQASQEGQRGINEIRKVLSYLKAFNISEDQVEVDITLARGLAYYTGAIFEVKANGVSIGSISGGGRYDNLTGVFGLPDVSGVGISFGVDRIYDVMEELKLFKEANTTSTKVLVCYFDEKSELYSLKTVTSLRAKGINAEVYPEQSKIKKQLDYANKKAIPYVIIVGDTEMETGKLTIKHMLTGTQENLEIDSIIQRLKL